MAHPRDAVFNQPFKASVKMEKEKKESGDIEKEKRGGPSEKGIVAPAPTRTQFMEMVEKTNVPGVCHFNDPASFCGMTLR